jgi:hypothetical protein
MTWMDAHIYCVINIYKVEKIQRFLVHRLFI